LGAPPWAVLSLLQGGFPVCAGRSGRRFPPTQKAFFSYQAGATGQVLLDDCDLRDYIETHNFSGFKIYPALGYYPFHEDLLPVWKYAVDHDLPVLTHCIRGTIFYRGAKKNEWNKHPVFQENVAGDNKPLLLNQTRNQDFCNNFTHPLNYLCLLKEPLLRILVARANPKVQQLFGFQDAQTPLLYNLNNLKLCFGHYGGEDEWLKYFETDRDQYTPALIKYANGIDFMFSKSSNGFSHDKIAQIWKSTDWYSIISSLILQHPNVYADISYTLHDPVIWPLLRHSLERQALPGETRRLADGVLYGTDFYVVRNHKSEKQLFAELEANLDPAQVDIVARINPARFVR